MSEENKKAKVGVYVCHCGGNISDVIDVAKVSSIMQNDPSVEIATDYIFMCSDPGQNMIIKDIKEKNLTHVVVASCSPRLHELTFRKAVMKAGLNPYLYEHVNIREQGSWVHHDDPDGATDKATHLIEGAVQRLLQSKPLEPIKKKVVQNALVVGGGVSGLTTALDLARSGITVDLVEKEGFLGGRVAQLTTLYPTETDAKHLISELIDHVVAEKRIEVHLNTEIIKGSGTIGNYELIARETRRGVTADVPGLDKAIEVCPVEVPDEFNYGLTNRKAIYRKYESAYPELPMIDWENCTRCGKCLEATNNAGIELTDDLTEEYTIFAGAIIMATGFDSYVPAEGEFGWGQDNVITLPQLIRHLETYDYANDKFIFNGKEIKSVAFIHCVGSRQIEGVHEAKNGNYNTHCSRTCCTATLQEATAIKEHFPKVDVFDFYREIRTYGFREDYYKNASEHNVIFLKYPDEEVPEITGKNGKLTIHTPDLLTYGAEVEVEADLVVLAVGMIPRETPPIVEAFTLPRGSNGFLQEAHPKLRPVESATDGVFLAGTAQTPMDVKESTLASTASAAKAASILSKEVIELSPFIAVVDEAICAGHEICATQCNYNAITYYEKDGKTKAQVDPGLCSGCGACLPTCPEEAIVLQGFDLKQLKAQVLGFVKELK